MREQQFNEMMDWQNETFGQATPMSKLAHLAEELGELIDDLKNDNKDRRLEFADCFFLLFGCAASDGMTYEDICNAIQEKFEINKARKWGNPDKNGVVNHIKHKMITVEDIKLNGYYAPLLPQHKKIVYNELISNKCKTCNAKEGKRCKGVKSEYGVHMGRVPEDFDSVLFLVEYFNKHIEEFNDINNASEK